MLKQLAIASFVALSSFAAVPAAMAEPICRTLQAGTACIDIAPTRYGWDSTDYVSFTLYGYEWLGVISCRDNPTTYDWEYDTVKGNAPTSVVRSFAEGYCEGRLYG